MNDDLLRQEIQDLEHHLGLVDDGPTSAQAAVISKAITALEEQAGLDLDEEDFDRVGRIAFEELGGDVEAAFGLVAEEVWEDQDGWEMEFQGQIEAKQEQLGRKLVPSEIDRIRDHHDDISDPDLEAAWTNIYGHRHTDEQVEAVVAKHQKAVEKLSTGRLLRRLRLGVGQPGPATNSSTRTATRRKANRSRGSCGRRSPWGC